METSTSPSGWEGALLTLVEGILVSQPTGILLNNRLVPSQWASLDTVFYRASEDKRKKGAINLRRLPPSGLSTKPKCAPVSNLELSDSGVVVWQFPFRNSDAIEIEALGRRDKYVSL